MEFSSAAACPLCAQQCTEDTSTHTHRVGHCRPATCRPLLFLLCSLFLILSIAPEPRAVLCWPAAAYASSDGAAGSLSGPGHSQGCSAAPAPGCSSSASPVGAFHQLSVLWCLKDLYVLWLDPSGNRFWWVTFQFLGLSLKEQVDCKVWNAYSERSDNKRVIGASTKISIFMFVKYF